jgi:hypothetical protein
LRLDDAIDLLNSKQLELIAIYPFLKDWSLSFDKAKRRAGVCRLTEKKIGISLWHIENNTVSVVLDTLLHEFAHAIAFELYKETGHGVQWKEIALELGATPKATGAFNLPEPPWVLVTYCSIENMVERIAPRFRRNKNIKKYAVRGKPNTKGNLFYLCADELSQFESGSIRFEQLNFIQ